MMNEKDKISYHIFSNFSYVPLKRKLQLKIERRKIKNLNLVRNLIHMLGFCEKDIEAISYKHKSDIIMNAHHPPDLDCAKNYLYIYCDILEPQIIGNTLESGTTIASGKYRRRVYRHD